MSYGEAFCEVYDALYPHDDLAEAAAARLALLAGNGPVLELGVGTGRIALPLAARLPAGSVWGVDSSEAMLEQLASKDRGRSVKVVCADMARLVMPPGTPRFSLVFAAFNTFYLLADGTSQEACLRRCHEVLEPGGRLVLELYRPAELAPNVDQMSHLDHAQDGRSVLITYNRSTSDRLVFNGHAEIEGARTGTWRMRPLPTGMLDATVTSVGFELEARWATWSGNHYFESVGRHVSVWRRTSSGVSTPGWSLRGE